MKKNWRKQVLLQLGWSKFELQQVSDKQFELEGFYIPPNYGGNRLELISNGMDFVSQKHVFETNVTFGDYKVDIWRVKATGIRNKSDGVIQIATHYENGNRGNSAFHDWFWVLNPNRALPPLPLMQYIGADDASWFHFAGGTWAEKSLRTFEHFTGKDRTSIKTIVDWGCGCARVSRHYFDLCNAQIVGLDIDNKVIEWCKENLPNGEWSCIPTSTPTPLEESSADLIIGHSVFTHLDEESQFSWLKELSRIVKPNGLVMVTVLGVYGTFLEPISNDEEDRLQASGFIEPNDRKKTTNKHIVLSKTDADYPSYHKGVFHMPEYIRNTWSKYFDIQAIIEGFADHQALCILKKK